MSTYFFTGVSEQVLGYVDDAERLIAGNKALLSMHYFWTEGNQKTIFLYFIFVAERCPRAEINPDSIVDASSIRNRRCPRNKRSLSNGTGTLPRR